MKNIYYNSKISSGAYNLNILIVDDNSSNRIILKLLLQEYEESKGGVVFNIKEASDGLEAVSSCRENSFDMVLMDIMMPNMDGIEATKIIRDAHPNIIIIAVSGVDDTDSQKMILNNGAEDYISKPINSDIFTSRMSNYITLSSARKQHIGKEKTNSKTINVISNNIYSRHTNFIIENEDSLSEFWEFFLLKVENKYDNLSDVIRTLFSIIEVYAKLSIPANVYIEESDEYQYFTLGGIDKLPPKVLELIIKKNKIFCEYKISNNKVTFELLKHSILDDDVEFKEQSEIQKVIKKEDKRGKNKEKSTKAEPNIISKKLVVFNYLDEDDLYDLEEYTAKLTSLMLIVGGGNVSEEEIIEMYTYLEKIGSVLTTYTEVYPISQALTMLSYEMANHIDEFIKNSEALGPMCKAFSNDMSSWLKMSFYTGAPSADFMNDTIVVNCETIAGMLKTNEDVNDSSFEDLDDIFDF